MNLAALLAEQEFDRWPYAADLTTLIVAIGGFIVVGLWWMSRRAAERPDD